jgi:hypothetical protein
LDKYISDSLGFNARFACPRPRNLRPRALFGKLDCSRVVAGLRLECSGGHLDKTYADLSLACWLGVEIS